MPSTVAKPTPRPLVTVVVAIIEHPQTQKILISKRTQGQHLAGLWEFPGGKVNKNETLFHALQRELLEEVGLHVSSAVHFKQMVHSYEETDVHLYFYKVSDYTGEAASREGQEIRWVERGDLGQYEFPEANRAVIKRLNLAPFWMITADCDIQQAERFVLDIAKSVKQHKLKQVLFRSKNLDDKQYYLVVERLLPLLAKLSCHLILNRKVINEDVSQAWHITSLQLHQHDSRPVADDVLLTASCHTLSDIKQAEKLTVDAILLSPVQKTSTHPEAKVLGWAQFKALAKQAAQPVYALGGVGMIDLDKAINHGAFGVAGISAFRNL